MEEKKREFKAVAMRFTQEAFDGMDKSGMEILDVFGFESQPYLVNNYSGIEMRVTNFEKQTAKCRDRKIIETCDPKLFRQFCGLENSIDESKESTSNHKREFRAIAMRCSQEDFDKMDKTGLNIVQICDFKHRPYIMNDYKGEEGLISNLNNPSNIFKIEFWNEDIFRICCGLEPKSKKEVIFNLKVKDNLSNKVGGIKERIEQLKKTSQFHSVAFVPPLFINLMNYTYEQKKIHDEMNECDKKPVRFSRVVSEKDFSTPYFKDLLSQLREKEMSNEMKHATNLEAAVRIYIDKPIECDNEPEIFQTKDIEFKGFDGIWQNYGLNLEFRFKPKPTPEESLSAEIESLSEKAKELGLKATVLFEKS